MNVEESHDVARQLDSDNYGNGDNDLINHSSPAQPKLRGSKTQDKNFSELFLANPAGSSRLQRWDEGDWRINAACAELGWETFFPVSETQEYSEQVEAAKTICTSCPVCDVCLEFAISTIQSDGIWGGTTEIERMLIKRARRRAATTARLKAQKLAADLAREAQSA
jgi:WhiB family transcriptional regulator, redox-sensing transcriptional regulator